VIQIKSVEEGKLTLKDIDADISVMDIPYSLDADA